MSAEVVQDKCKSLSLSPLQASFHRPERFPGALILSLRWEGQWIWLRGPPRSQRKTAPFVNKPLEAAKHDVIKAGVVCDPPPNQGQEAWQSLVSGLVARDKTRTWTAERCF